MKALLVCILFLYSVCYVVSDDLCAVDGVPALNVTDTLRRYFGPSNYTDKVRQGEAIFSRESSKWNVSKENGFLFDEEPARVQNLINTWTAAGYLTPVDKTNFMYAYDNSIGARGYGEQIFGISNPNGTKWAFYRFMSIRKKNQRLIVPYTFLILQLKDTSVNFTLPENRALMRFVDYQDRKNFHEQQGVKFQQFLNDFNKCR